MLVDYFDWRGRFPVERGGRIALKTIEVSEMERPLKRGDVVRLHGQDGELHPRLCLVMGVVSHMGEVRVTVQPQGTVRTIVVRSDVLSVVQDADGWKPTLAMKFMGGTFRSGRVGAVRNRRSAKARATAV